MGLAAESDVEARAVPMAPRLRAVRPLRVASAVLLVVAIGVAGYVLTTRLQERDREDAARRRAQVESVGAQSALADARSAVASLGNVLAGEPDRSQRRFAQLAGGSAGSVGLIDAVWVQRIPAGARRAYERRLGAPITRLAGTGFVRAPPAPAYLPASFTTATRMELRSGVDVSTWSALPAAIGNRASVFAVGASLRGSLGREPGFYLLEAADFGRGADRHGFLAVFVPRGWLTRALQQEPRGSAIYLDGHRLEGGLDKPAASSAAFTLVGRHWRIDVGKPAATAWQSTFPWIALTWPLVLALLITVVGRGILGRRRAEAEFERMFHISRDPLCIAGLDGTPRRVNPALERTIGRTADEIVTMPIEQLVHPDDHARTREALAQLARGEDVADFEHRTIRPDGEIRRLEWSARPVPGGEVFYAAARDVTDRRRTERELEQLAQEQAALRRVATLVARDAPPGELLDAVVREARQLVGASVTRLFRYDDEETATVMAADTEPGLEIPIGSAVSLAGENAVAMVWRTGRAARQEGLGRAAGPLAARVRRMGLDAAMGAPVSVQGRLWGVLIGAWQHGQIDSPDETEMRLSQFAELVAVAIANAESRTQLAASRARVVATADETRRRIERDLHDATQQRLVSLGLELRAAEAALPDELSEVKSQLAMATGRLTAVLEEVQEISRGIHPAILTTGGLGPALRTLARRSALPVELDVQLDGRLPQPVEVAAYFVVSEALTNVAKHAQASEVHVGVAARGAGVDVHLRDDGVGGADPGAGSGLVGLRDRVEALGGTLAIASPPGGGTALSVRIPIIEEPA